MAHKCVYTYICDRCGKKFGEIDPYKNPFRPFRARIRERKERKKAENSVKGFLTIFYDRVYYDDDRYELCQDCMDSLKKWVSHPELDNKQTELSGEAKKIYDGMLDKLSKK